MTGRAAFLRLSALVASVVLLTSRVALLVHELGGHAAPALLFGGRVTGWYLFAFAGGRVSYRLGELSTGRRLVVSLGGITLELLAGVVAFLLARRWRRHGTVAFAQLCVGTVLVGHAAMYLARGVHYGFGDGALLARSLGAGRVVVVLASSALAVGVAVGGGRRLARHAASFFAGTPRRAAAAILLVFACAGLVHGALAFAEIRWFPDPAWVRVMEEASLGAAREEVARRMAEAKRRGEQPMSAEEQARMTEALERARRPWPLDPLLAIAVVTGLGVGVMRGTREQRALMSAATLPRWWAIGGVVAALGAVIAIILALRHLGATLTN
ncbi:MAG: hypothetical protein JWP87_5759 [Labilithrix sp.]|nr:hypothetical protein [Labilithrix sp.]